MEKEITYSPVEISTAYKVFSNSQFELKNSLELISLKEGELTWIEKEECKQVLIDARKGLEYYEKVLSFEKQELDSVEEFKNQTNDLAKFLYPSKK